LVVVVGQRAVFAWTRTLLSFHASVDLQTHGKRAVRAWATVVVVVTTMKKKRNEK